MASIGLLKNFLRIIKKAPSFNWMMVSICMMVSRLPAVDKQNTLLKYLGLSCKLKIRRALFI